MPQEARKPTPKGNQPGPARQEAHRVLQRRLRQTVRGIEWRDAIAGALLGQLLDALGGRDASKALEDMLAFLLNS